MKKTWAVRYVVAAVCGVLLLAQTVLAAATVPDTSLWFTPASAAVGDTITLNSLVYNSQSVDASVTVVFDTPTVKLDSVTESIPAQTAKTVSIQWKMPASTTTVTATITAAVDANKKSLPALIGKLGSVSVGVTPTTIIDGVPVSSFPGSAQLTAWFGPLLAKIEAYRLAQATYFATLRDTAKAKLNVNITTVSTVITQPETPAPANPPAPTAPQVPASQPLGSPLDWLTYIFAASFATLYASQALFYIVLVLLVLLLLRIIVNLIF